MPKIIDCCHLDKYQQARIANSLRSQLIGFNSTFCDDSEIMPVLFTIKQQGEICGGLVGRIAWEWMHIEIIWLSSGLRNKGFGRQLIEKAEKIARQKGCTGVHLDTFSFQAPDFYTGIGYKIFGKIEDYPKGQCRYFLKKKFADQ
ncbi:GNAT family N-acetyltransferase [Desulfosediminicola ganghwensis]|uniref:GNAT family N-acetyltransferase n=1 Tax=Desulfosediminicola ganghwensis TaxID=2569540 RepID=UPI0010AB6640|nr:GNAT family N-acetyltransferase [Desulfosediminicola ganghwensis]